MMFLVYGVWTEKEIWGHDGFDAGSAAGESTVFETTAVASVTTAALSRVIFLAAVAETSPSPDSAGLVVVVVVVGTIPLDSVL